MMTIDDVKGLKARFERHRDALEEALKQEPGDDRYTDLLEDAETALEALDPILETYAREATEDELQEMEAALADLAGQEETLAQELD
jgi:hypothetical protein